MGALPDAKSLGAECRLSERIAEEAQSLISRSENDYNKVRMHRAILIACFPYFLWLLAGFAGLWLVLRISGGRLALAKLRGLHRCQQGGVQTLSFVLTLPVFMMIVLFIVQVSQLMIGITVVHYAAFAAARAASVWIPAHISLDEPANDMGPLAIAEGNFSYPDWYTTQKTNFNTISPQEKATVAKYYRVWSAAALACMPIAPSHQYMTTSAMQQIGSQNGVTIPMTTLYQSLVSRTSGNPQIANRLRNKAAYAFDHTMIVISGTDISMNGSNGPTYNPVSHPQPTDMYSAEYNFPQAWQYKRSEIGWQDPITVMVKFDFPLLTGPGRFLSPGHFMSAKLSPAGGTPDRVSNRIQIWNKNAHPGYSENVYFTILTASATITNEGMKSSIAFPEKWDWLMQ